MIPLSPPPQGIDEREVVRRLSLLDPCSAWREDLADAGLTEPLDDALTDQWVLWLQIATVFDRLRALPVSARAAYARGTTALWQTAERVTGAARFARVGEVMAAWDGAAPALEGYRELLWAVEQGEAEGALRVTYNALFALRSLVPDADIRSGYAGAQAGRVLRTLGLLEPALRAFEEAEELAWRAGDAWLQVRVKLGIGVVYQARGNYPAAREIFKVALEGAHPFVDLRIGAHLGLVSAARATEEYDVALEHGWLALQYARGNRGAEVEALTILASLSLEVGEFGAALATCRLALAKGASQQMQWELLRYLVEASVGLDDQQNVRAHLKNLVAAVERTPDPWREAQGRRVIGEALAYLGDTEQAALYFEQSRSIAIRGSYAELSYRADEALAALSKHGQAAHVTHARSLRISRSTSLDDASQAVIDQLCCLA